MARRYDEAIVQLERTLKLDPDYQQAHRRLGSAYAGVGRFEEAIAEHQIVVKLSGNNPSSLGTLAQIYAKAGRHAEARRILGDLLMLARTRYISPGVFASIYLALGEADPAFPWIERAYRERSNYIAYIGVDDTRDALGSDPRYRDLLRRVGLE